MKTIFNKVSILLTIIFSALSSNQILAKCGHEHGACPMCPFMGTICKSPLLKVVIAVAVLAVLIFVAKMILKKYKK